MDSEIVTVAKMAQDKTSVIIISPDDVSTVIESQKAELESGKNLVDASISSTVHNAAKMELESDNSSCHQAAATSPFAESDSINSNYYVLVESADGSQVISRVIPDILSGSGEESQLALNTVLHSDISYIDGSALGEAKDQQTPGYTSESVTMIIDPSLPVQESQKIFIESSSSFVNMNSPNISTEKLAIIDKTPDQTLGEGIPQKYIIDRSLLSPQYQSVQVSSEMKVNSSGPQIRIIDVSNWDSNGKQVSERSLDLISVHTEAEKLDEQRQINLRLLEQSHREHQENLLQRRNNEGGSSTDLKNDTTEKMLKEAGIDDNTPIFSNISAKINPELLVHVPGCQKFLLNEASRKGASAGLNFSSELDCSFTGDIEEFVLLYMTLKSLLKLISQTNLVLEKSKGRVSKENKNIGCNLLVPYVSSKGRHSKQSSKLMQMGGLLNLVEYLSDGDLDNRKGNLKRQRRSHRKRRVPPKNKYKLPQVPNSNCDTDQDNNELNDLGNDIVETEQEEYSQSQLLSEMSTVEVENLVTISRSTSNELAEASIPNLDDPVQRRLLEEQIKCRMIYDENSKLKQMKAAVIAQRKEMEQSTEAEALPQPCIENDNTQRITKGRPPKKFDPSETIGRVKPRNPLTESSETKQRRMYEENVTFKFFCNQCSFKTKRQSQFNQHLAYHQEGATKLHCRHCDFISISLPALKQHELVHKTSVLKCEVCNVYITDKKHLMQKHMRMKHSPRAMAAMGKTINCSQCSATFTSRVALGKHKAIHLKSQQVSQISPGTSTANMCPHCKKCFGKKIHLHRHMKDVHGPQNRPHLCDICGSSFKRKDALLQHRFVHVAKSARNLPFKCNKCDKAFRSQAHLKEHSSLHSSDRPFLCQYCGASFKTQPVQKKHILTLHIQPRTHVCAVCCRQFNTKNSLQRHENTHKPKVTPAAEEVRQWESGVVIGDGDGIKKIEIKEEAEVGGVNEVSVSDRGMMMSLEEDQATTALVVETEEGTQVMVDPSLVPAMMAASSEETHASSNGTRTLEVQQALIQGGQADHQAFYYLAGDHLQTIQ